MTNKLILAAAAFSLLSAPALAESPAQQAYSEAARNGDITSGAGDRGPGGLTSAEIVGKRLLDAEGNPIGMIEKVTGDGQSAVVRSGATRMSVEMKYLSLGTGAHTVIKQDYSQADRLNGRNAAALAAEEKSRLESATSTTTYSGSSQPATATTVITTTHETRN